MEFGRTAFRQSLLSLVVTLSIVALGVTVPWIIDGDADTTTADPAVTVVRVRTIGSGWERVGSGVLTSDGVLTNRHVVAGASEVVIEYADGATRAVSIVRDGGWLDLAVLELAPNGVGLRDGGEVAAARWAAASARVGDVISVRGFPGGGEFVDQGGTVSFEVRGEVAPDPDRLWQLDVAVRPGSSGSGVFSSSDELIGIVYAAAFGDNGALVMRADDIQRAAATATVTNLVKCSG